jgi:hypothetical protein
MVNDQLTMVNGQLLTINCNVLVKSRKVRHCERSEAISWVITICNYWIALMLHYVPRLRGNDG